MANTFIQLNDTPSSYDLAANKFAKVNNAGDRIQFWNVQLNDIEEIVADGAYTPDVGETLIYHSDNKWKPGSMDVYSAGNGINKAGLSLNVLAGMGGGLTSNATGVYISDIANVSGTYGAANTIPTFTVNDKGQITAISNVALVADQAQTITDDFIGSLSGTSGQITVTDGTGNNAQARVNLVATGVTAATYGNATTVPQITVDAYGRIQNVDQIAIAGGGSSGSGNVNLAYKTIQVAGQIDLAADEAEDILTFREGAGVTITTDPADDAITISASADNIIGNASVGDLADVSVTGATNGQALVYNASASRFEASNITPVLPASGVSAGTYGDTGNVAQFTVDSTGVITSVTEIAIPQGDITGVDAGAGLGGGGGNGNVSIYMEQTGATPGTYGGAGKTANVTVDVLGRVTSITETDSLPDSGVVAGTYGAGTVIPQFTVNEKGVITDVANINVASFIQSLSWNASTKRLSLSGGNTVDLSVMMDDTEQTLSLAGNVITISGSDSNVDLTTALAGVGGGISTSEVDSHLNISSATSNQVLSWNGSDYAWIDQSSGGGGSASNAFSTISVTGQNDVVASGEDTVTYVAGNNITLETDASAQSITISSNIVNQGLDFGTFDAPSGITLDMGSF